MIVGALFTVFGVLGWISLFVLPFFERFEVVYDKDKEIIQARTDPEFGKHVWYEKRHLKRDFTVCVFAGILMLFAGFYLGYAAKGEGFWLYRKMFPDRITVQTWDEINEDGQYVAEDGRAFTYYVLVSGDKVSLSGEPCADLTELKNKLTAIKRENTVIIIDSFAVSSTYRSVENMLNEMGIDYEETR
jgi:hypothetical protein